MKSCKFSILNEDKKEEESQRHSYLRPPTLFSILQSTIYTMKLSNSHLSIASMKKAFNSD